MCPAPDGMIPGEPTAADVERDYPQWRTCVGVDRLCHALRRRGAALTARGEDWQDLMDQIRAAESMLRESRSARWAGSADPARP